MTKENETTMDETTMDETTMDETTMDETTMDETTMDETTMDETTMDEIIEKLKNTIFDQTKTNLNDKLCNVKETTTHYINCKTEKDISDLNTDLPPGKCGSFKINKTCIDFFFEKLNKLTYEQKSTLNSLNYILKKKNLAYGDFY